MAIFDPSFAPTRYAGNPIIDVDAGSAWLAAQAYDPVPVVNPSNSNQILLFITGMALPTGSEDETVGLFTIDISDPDPDVWLATLTEVGEIIAGRCGSVVIRDGVFFLYYTVGTSSGEFRLITSSTPTDLESWAAYGTVLTADGQGRDDGTAVNNPFVPDDDPATMIYGYRDGGTVLPGYRYATTSDGYTWAKAGSDILTNPGFQSEWCSGRKIGQTCFLVYEKGPPYTVEIATGSSWRSAFTNIGNSPFIDKSGGVGTFDRYHVATGSKPMLIHGQWWIFYCGARDHDTPYGTNHWSLGIVSIRLHSVAARSL